MNPGTAYVGLVVYHRQTGRKGRIVAVTKKRYGTVHQLTIRWADGGERTDLYAASVRQTPPPGVVYESKARRKKRVIS